jgi:hypothetical protein
MRGTVIATALALFGFTSAAYADCGDAHQAAAMSAKAEQTAPAQTQAATKPQVDKVAKTAAAPAKQVVKVKAPAQPTQDQKVASSTTN